jgi:conjugative relaxase-like TrwC/TraI family protein
MLRITKVRSAHAASSYFERDDYYADGKSPSAWLGRGAEALGLEGSVEREAFQRALAGELPNGQKLGTMRDGEWQHAPGWDLTFSAPKSVSILAEAGGDRRLIEAHERAVRGALDVLEREAAMTRLHTREGGDAVRHERTGNLLVATFLHETSRARDPQLHTHAIVANATQSADGKWRSLESRDMYRVMQLAGQIYQAELARECRQLGYTIERAGGGGQFELREVPGEIRALASKRTEQINEWLNARGHDPKTAGREVVDRAVLATRATKEDLSAKELRAQWRAELLAAGFDAQAVARAARSVEAMPSSASAREAVAAAIEQLTEREHVFTERELLRAALVQGLDRGAALGEIEAEIAHLRQRGELQNRELDGLQAYTSRTAIRLEKEMLAGADKLHGGEALLGVEEAARIVHRAAEAGPHSWTTDQRESVFQLLTAEHRLMLVQGLAGTAKTSTALKVTAGEHEARGYTIRAIAPGGDQAQALGRSLGCDHATLASHLIAAKAGRLGERELWVVDEAGTARTRDIRDLLRAAERSGARVILAGDVRQLGSVEAGRAFDQLQERVPEQVVKLEQIVRQQNEELRAGVYAAARGDVRTALEQVERAGGKILIADSAAERYRALADEYLALPREARERTIVMSTSREGRAKVNGMIREGLRREGIVQGRDARAAALEKRDLTRTERKAAWSYQVGDLVRFGRDYKQLGIERDKYYRVAALDQAKNRVHLVGRGGEEVAWHPDKRGAKTAQVYCESERQVAAGDRLVWTQNNKDLGLTNRDRLTVQEASEREIRARTKDGREVRLDLTRESHRHFDHSYCPTITAAQGQDQKISLYEMSSKSPLAHQRSMYVGMSRAQEKVVIVTDSKTELARAAQERSGEKTAALEQARAADRARREPERATPRPRNHQQEYLP